MKEIHKTKNLGGLTLLSGSDTDFLNPFLSLTVPKYRVCSIQST